MIELYPHQQKAVDELHNGAILWGGVGTGKTITALVYYYTKVCGGIVGDLGSLRQPKDLYVITTAKKRDSLDWEGDAVRFGLGTSRETSVDGIRIHVDSWNNIPKYEKVTNAFFIFDEQRLVGSGAWTKSFIKIAKDNEWILLSATPGDTWLDYIPVFVANGFYKNRTEFKRRHVVYNNHTKWPKVERYLEPGHLVRLRNSILVEMPYKRHTTRIMKEVLVEHDEELFEKAVKKRWHVYENRPLRDVGELFTVMRKVANSDLSRLYAVSELMNKHQKLIVFYNFDYELEMLRTLVPPDQLASSASIQDLKQKLDSQPRSTMLLGPSLEQSSESTKTKKESTSTLNSTTEGLSSEKTLERLNSSETITNGSTMAHSQRLTSTETASNSLETPAALSERKDETSWESEQLSEQLKKPQFLGSPIATQTQKPVDTESLAQGQRSITTSCTSVSVAAHKYLTSFGEDAGSSMTPSMVNGSRSNQPTESEGEEFSVAEWNGHKHEPIPETDRWVYLVQYVAGAEGWNCTETDAMVFWSLTYSYKNFHQAQGRIDRLNTPFSQLYYYVLKSNSSIDKTIWRSLQHKQSFNEASFGSKMLE